MSVLYTNFRGPHPHRLGIQYGRLNPSIIKSQKAGVWPTLGSCASGPTHNRHGFP